MVKVHGYAAQQATTPLAPFDFDRRDLRPNDVQIDILYCGVCHSDLHTARNEWKSTIYPFVPGHEIVGKVLEVGEEVKDLKKGDVVAVGCMVDSCRTCKNCKDGLEQYCDTETIFTYNSRDRHDKSVTYGGYSTQIIVDRAFVLHVPKEFKETDYPGVAPLLCAGITTYSPLKHWKVGEGSLVGVVGLGGLGHMAIKLAHAMGAHVVLFTTSASKVQDAKRLGADEVVLSKNEEEMKKHVGSFDFILDTVAASHNLDPFIQLLKRDGTLCLVGAPEFPHPSPTINQLIFKRRQIAGSLIGGIKETQEMLDFCAKHHITADIELIPIGKINEAYDRMLKSDVKYRFVIDSATLKK
ncbi:Zinc-dependent alcohol dehydrogenase [Candidatus Protochlamydia naegleriophila]|uniref:Zinc-dependent alcohol dehydrogenase n=1 Tax=Candidatus Protochlamydia naegleriophila TaxID=389348 RepID=A0A0U5JBD3_9BACT|nr:NAD(P)-dependent alcohol dehydrogenase [Candidatus Protochlamydia naegleriophila]CUI16413.1 Zinc-dependent alcohol dehydrogenase [Candidatus Protochlamydia naegleriophila]